MVDRGGRVGPAFGEGISVKSGPQKGHWVAEAVPGVVWAQAMGTELGKSGDHPSPLWVPSLVP